MWCVTYVFEYKFFCLCFQNDHNRGVRRTAVQLLPQMVWRYFPHQCLVQYRVPVYSTQTFTGKKCKWLLMWCMILVQYVTLYVPKTINYWVSEWDWLINVTCNDISVKYVTAHRWACGLKKKLDLRSDSQRHRHFLRFFNVPVQAATRGKPFYMIIPRNCPI